MTIDEQDRACPPALARFHGQVAVVTGGGSGIGAATARRLAAEGALVVVADCDADSSRRVALEIDGVALTLDVVDGTAVRTGLSRVHDELGPVDVLVNNAGGDRVAFFLDTDPSDWLQVMHLNLLGAMACTRAVLRTMYERRAGAIVNVASEAGVVGTVGGAAYSAAKAGLIGFTKAIGRESARYGVRCNSVAPGPIETGLLARTASSGPRGAAMTQAMIDATVMGRAGRPEEVAAAIAFLASHDASYITGHTLAVSGGVSMS